MSLPAVIAERWPELARRLSALPAGAGGVVEVQGSRRRHLVRGQSFVSAADPEREAARWVSSTLAGRKPDCVHLIGHGLGWEVRELLSHGVGELRLYATDLPILGFALEHWACRELLGDPRLHIVADIDDVAMPSRDSDLVLEMPFWRRVFPEACATTRVALGHLRSAGLHLRILVVEPLYGGSLPMARSAAAALRSLGHEVRSLDLEQMAGARECLQAFGDRHPGGNPLAGEFSRLLAKMLLIEARSFRPDLVLGLAQSPLTPEVAQQLREADIRTAYWFVEDWETLDYWRGLHGHFDLFLTIQRGRFLKELAALSANTVRYLPACADPSQCHPEAWIGQNPPQVSFVGAGYHNRERFLLELLDLPLRIWGTDWRREGPLAARLENNGLRTSPADNRRIFSNSRINLNLHSSTYHAGINPDGDFVNPRTFEILACGGFQLVDSRSLLPELLKPGEDLVCFNSARQLKEQIRHHLAHDAERASIAEHGRNTVLARHTYRHRMAELLELMLLENADAFPDATRRIQLVSTDQDPEIGEWLRRLPDEAPRELETLADWLRGRRQPLDETGAILLFMSELRGWAREKGVDRLLEQQRHG